MKRWLLLAVGCTNGKGGDGRDSAGEGCGEPIGSAETISTPILDELEALYERSGGPWGGTLGCESGSPTAAVTFAFAPGPASELLVPAGARSGEAACPAASDDEIAVSVRSDRWSYDGFGEVTLSPEGMSDRFHVYAEEAGEISVRFYLDGSTQANLNPDGCAGPLTRQTLP